MKSMPGKSAADLVSRVHEVVAERISSQSVPIDGEELAQLCPGKMLRTRLAGRLISAAPVKMSRGSVERICAATEMVHTASLCHDDVIDGGILRRERPALWRVTTTSGAVLIGDILLCEAMRLVIDTEGGRYIRLFVEKTHEVCSTEAEQELFLRDKVLDAETCERIARGKTGPLFAVIGHVCGGEDSGRVAALEEAGYQIGTAYQLADDLLDQCGDEESAGKTLGTDRGRRKFTLAQESASGGRAVEKRIGELCRGALGCVEGWPDLCKGMAAFFAHDLQPVFNQFSQNLDIRVRLKA